MNKLLYYILSLAFVFGCSETWAGNPDRQGEAGAPELLMNPWARSAGLHTMSTSMITGAEAMRLNIAGLARINKTEIILANTNYLSGTDIQFNALGLAQKIGENSALGISLMAIDFGEIPVTTADLPGGTGATFKPRYFNIGLGFSHIFENKVSVGVLVRSVTEGIEDVTASAIALDAGVQYVTGEKDNFKFGISLRNVGGRMEFKGEGLADEVLTDPFDNPERPRVLNQRVTAFELQSVLNIGLSYDFYVSGDNRVTALGNYTSNAFSEDQIGMGLEFSFKDLVMLRGAYKLDFSEFDSGLIENKPLYTGLSLGATLNVPVSKEENAPRLAFDYAYRTTRVFSGTHNFSLRINI
ncbi:MAG TPA: PorV/PorQ family protein [Bacteroidetes bacterium]|nr:PorV/PorQ family protein [Bacteroidota bacterium]